MKTLTRLAACIFMLSFTMGSIEISAQSTGDNNPFPGKFLGFNGAQNLEFRTNNLTRMQQMETGNSTINGFSIARGGFLGLSQDPTFFTAGAASPFSLLHLNGDNPSGLPQQAGYRDWMRYGLTFTHNQDFMYVGQRRVGATDVTDAVIAWADNGSGSIGPDNLTFLFTPGAGGDIECARMIGEGYTGIGTSWSNSLQPKRTLDVIRINDQPQFRITRAASSGLLGGTHADFQVSAAGNLHIRPRLSSTRAVAIGFLESELPDPINAIGARLDVGGITRIRNTPVPEMAHCLIVGNNVLGNQADNVLTRIDFPNDPTLVLAGDATWVNVSALDCRWVDIASSTIGGEVDIASGFNTTSDCYRGKLAFGAANSTQSKVYVKNTLLRDRVLIGLHANTETFDDENIEAIGVLGESESAGVGGSQLINIGVKGFGKDSRSVVGVLGIGRGLISSTGNSFGVRGEASGGQNSNYGVYGEAPIGSNSVYSAGTPATTGPTVTLSDESVKTNVANLQNGLELIGQLQPKTYTYIQEGNESMNFNYGLHYGFLAQDVQAVLPDVVMPFFHPAQYDSLGNEISPDRELLGIKYTDIVPVLVQAVKEANGIVSEQGALIQSQNDQINALQEQNSMQQQQLNEIQQQMASMLTVVQAMQAKTNNCCNDGSTGLLNTPTSTNEGVKLMQNVPNPFDTHTRIDFTLPSDANVVLELSDAQGRPLRRLVDGQMNAGQQSIMLDGSSLAPGMYYYTVYANGEMITKKMIKR